MRICKSTFVALSLEADDCRKYDIFPAMIDIAKSAIKEKVVRAIVSIWKVRILVLFLSLLILFRISFFLAAMKTFMHLWVTRFWRHAKTCRQENGLTVKSLKI